MLHYLTVHKWLGDVDDTWHAANYYQVGFKGAAYGHNILGMSEHKHKGHKSHKKAHSHFAVILRELMHLSRKFHM